MPVAVVTGSNKGIGFGIVRALCKQFSGDVYLTSRDEGRGLAAVAELNKEGLQPKFHVLDIGNEETVTKFRDFMKEQHGGIDVLVNNAGIAFKQAATEPFSVQVKLVTCQCSVLCSFLNLYFHQAKVTLATNYWANKRACEILFPILKPGARVVNISSSCGWLGHITKSGERGGEPTKAEAIHKSLADPELSLDTLDSLMTNFVETAEAGTHKEAGWPSSTYFVSKIGWSALSR